VNTVMNPMVPWTQEICWPSQRLSDFQQILCYDMEQRRWIPSNSQDFSFSWRWTSPDYTAQQPRRTQPFYPVS
jgi:hypothetical protein